MPSQINSKFTITAITGQAQAELNKLGSQFKRTATGIKTQSAEVNRSVLTLGQGLRSLSRFGGVLSGLFAGSVISRAVRGLAELSDTAQTLQARLRLITPEGQSAEQTFQNLFDLSTETRSSFEATAGSFVRVSGALQGIDSSGQLALDTLRTTNQLIQLSGVNSATAAAGLNQFIQGLSSDRLGGEELRSVLENIPALATAIFEGLQQTSPALVEGFDNASQALRELSQQGLLTAETVTGALSAVGPQVAEDFQNLPQTFAQVITQIRNEILQLATDNPALAELSTALGDAARAGFDGFKALLPVITPIISGLAAILPTVIQLAGAFAAVKVSQGLLALPGLLTRTVAGFTASITAAKAQSRAILESATASITLAKAEQQQAIATRAAANAAVEEARLQVALAQGKRQSALASAALTRANVTLAASQNGVVLASRNVGAAIAATSAPGVLSRVGIIGRAFTALTGPIGIAVTSLLIFKDILTGLVNTDTGQGILDSIFGFFDFDGIQSNLDQTTRRIEAAARARDRVAGSIRNQTTASRDNASAAVQEASAIQQVVDELQGLEDVQADQSLTLLDSEATASEIAIAQGLLEAAAQARIQLVDETLTEITGKETEAERTILSELAAGRQAALQEAVSQAQSEADSKLAIVRSLKAQIESLEADSRARIDRINAVGQTAEPDLNSVEAAKETARLISEARNAAQSNDLQSLQAALDAGVQAFEQFGEASRREGSEALDTSQVKNFGDNLKDLEGQLKGLKAEQLPMQLEQAQAESDAATAKVKTLESALKAVEDIASKIEVKVDTSTAEAQLAALTKARTVTIQTQVVDGRNAGGPILGLNSGGPAFAPGNGANQVAPGAGNTDTVPAMLTPGEFVVNKGTTEKVGISNLFALQRGEAELVPKSSDPRVNKNRIFPNKNEGETQFRNAGGPIFPVQKFQLGGNVKARDILGFALTGSNANVDITIDADTLDAELKLDNLILDADQLNTERTLNLNTREAEANLANIQAATQAAFSSDAFAGVGNIFQGLEGFEGSTLILPDFEEVIAGAQKGLRQAARTLNDQGRAVFEAVAAKFQEQVGKANSESDKATRKVLTNIGKQIKRVNDATSKAIVKIGEQAAKAIERADEVFERAINRSEKRAQDFTKTLDQIAREIRRGGLSNEEVRVDKIQQIIENQRKAREAVAQGDLATAKELNNETNSLIKDISQETEDAFGNTVVSRGQAAEDALRFIDEARSINEEIRLADNQAAGTARQEELSSIEQERQEKIAAVTAEESEKLAVIERTKSAELAAIEFTKQMKLAAIQEQAQAELQAGQQILAQQQARLRELQRGIRDFRSLAQTAEADNARRRGSSFGSFGQGPSAFNEQLDRFRQSGAALGGFANGTGRSVNGAFGERVLGGGSFGGAGSSGGLSTAFSGRSPDGFSFGGGRGGTGFNLNSGGGGFSGFGGSGGGGGLGGLGARSQGFNSRLGQSAPQQSQVAIDLNLGGNTVQGTFPNSAGTNSFIDELRRAGRSSRI